MEIQQLQYFVTAAKYQHMTKAANILHIAQPALSQSIKRLENELGVKLFIRSGRNVILSSEGKLLYDKTLPILRSIDNLPALMNSASDIAGRTINIIALSASELITDLIIKYKASQPDTLFQISQQNRDTDWDIKISSIIPSHKEDTSHIALKEEIFMAVPSDSIYACYKSISLEAVKDAPFICLDDSRPFTRICNNYCYNAGFEPKAAFESDSPSTVRKLIEAGLGVSFWPAYSWGPQNSPKVKLLTITSQKCTRQIYIVQNKKYQTKLKDDFYNFVVNTFKNM